MKGRNFYTSIKVKTSSEEALKKILQIEKWWVKKFSGSTEKLNDRFHVPMGETFVDFQVTELVPYKRIEWTVVDCYIHWLQDQREWNGTKVVFEISQSGESTQIHFTHLGLTPDVECYRVCEEGWTRYIKESLPKFFATGEGTPHEGDYERNRFENKK